MGVKVQRVMNEVRGLVDRARLHLGLPPDGVQIPPREPKHDAAYERATDNVVAAVIEHCHTESERWLAAAPTGSTDRYGVPTTLVARVPTAMAELLEVDLLSLRTHVFDLVNEEAGNSDWEEAQSFELVIEGESIERVVVRTVAHDPPTSGSTAGLYLTPDKGARIFVDVRETTPRVGLTRHSLGIDDLSVPSLPLQFSWSHVGIDVRGVNISIRLNRIVIPANLPVLVSIGDTIEIRGREQRRYAFEISELNGRRP